MKDMYDLEPESVKKFLRRKNVERALVQLPAGLRPSIEKIKEVFDEEGGDALFLARSCHGACDIADKEAKELGCDALIHYGHADMGVPTILPTLYVEARMKVEPYKTLKKALPELRDKSWGLTTTVQHIDFLEGVREFLKERGVKSVVGDPGPRCKYPGQILGCDWGSARSVADEVNGFLYIGTGKFHPIGVVLATNKPVVSVNPLEGDYEMMEPELEEFLRKRYAMLTKAESRKSFGILVSTMQGQNRPDLARTLAKKFEKGGYEPYILTSVEIDPEVLKDYRLGAFVNTACPRIPIDDVELYEAPILTPFEAEVLLGERDWTPYRLDEIGVNFEA